MKAFLISVYNREDCAHVFANAYRVRIATQKQIGKMKKLMVIVTAVTFVAGSLGFIGCGGIDEDPDAAANEAKSEEFAPDPGNPDDDPVTSTDIPAGAGKFGIPPEKKD